MTNLAEQTTDVLVQEFRLFEDRVEIPLTGGLFKSISIPDFKSIFNSVIEDEENAVLEEFNLPSNVFYFAKSGSRIHISCYYKEKVAGILYDEKPMKVVMPNTIISHVLKAGMSGTWNMSSSKYFCTDLSVGRLPQTFIDSVQASKGVYLFPFSNTYNDGLMCYGSNQMPQKFLKNNLRALDWYYQYLFESSFNSDLGVRAVSHNYSVTDWYKLLQATAKEGRKFPYDKLTGYKVL